MLAAAALALVLAVSATGAPIARTTSLISAPTGVADPDTDGVNFEGASADGSRVFLTTDQRLTADDNDSGRQDVYVRSGGTTSLLSASTGVIDPDTANVDFVGASADGSRVFFTTTQRLTTDDNDTDWLDVYERTGGVTSLVSGPTGVLDPNTGDVTFGGASADGSRVFLDTTQTLTADDGDTIEADAYERAGGTTTLVSQSTGVADPGGAFVSFRGASDDGTRVFFSSTAKFTADDLDTGRSDIYERAGGVTTLVSGPTGIADPNTSGVTFRDASADGSRVLFETTQKLTADDGDTTRGDVYERAGGVTSLMTKPTGIADPNTDGAFFVGASPDGSRVFFTTAQKLTADDETTFIDVYERAGGVTTLVSGPTGVPEPNTGDVTFGGVSADGSRVFFNTAQKLTVDDLDSSQGDVYEHAGGTTGLVSKPTGIPDPNTDNASFDGASADGSRVYFRTDQKLTANDTDTDLRDVYERAEGTTTLITQATGVDDPDSFEAEFEAASADGTRVFFRTSQKLTADDGDSSLPDIYMAADTTAPETTITDGPSGTTGDSTPSFGFSSNEAGASFECKLNAGAFASCTSPTTLAALADGAHSFQVRATDNVGNVDASPAVSGFTVDTSAPAAPPADETAPAGKLSGNKTQKLGKSVAVTVACLDEACRAVASGSVSVPSGAAKNFKLKRAAKSIPKGGKAKLKLKLSKKARKAARRALGKGRKVRVKLKVTITDAAGNARVLRRTVKLKR